MLDEATAALISALAIPSGRAAAADQLARHLDAATLLVLVEDAVAGAYLPAPGFRQTLPGGPSWRAFLEQARHPGVATGTVPYPDRDCPAPAIAYAGAGLMLVFVGGSPARASIDALGPLVPLLARTLALEHVSLVARAELAMAREQAREAESLAHALDAARTEVERTVQALAGQARELEDARVRAEAATRAKDEFMAMLGHELRNPLSPILTALQLMRLKNHSSREQDIIERQVQSLMRLVDDLLDISRITQGKVELRKERLELAEIASRAVELSSPVLEGKRQILQVAIPARGLVIDADPSRLAQVLANLLTNAAKYSDPDTRVVFSAESCDGRVRISVKDEGIGMSPELLDRVFEVFVQNRQGLDRSQGGLGLGLAIVRSLVALHGGTVTAFSQGEGRGSEFVVELPQLPAEADADLRADVVAGVTLPSHRGERVLVVDDNEDAAALLSEALDALGYVVRTAPDGPTALRVAGTFHPEVAVLDIGLPVMDGYQLARGLRELAPAAALRLVAVTGYGQQEDRLRSHEAGFDAHLVKPIDLDQLRDVLYHLNEPKSSS